MYLMNYEKNIHEHIKIAYTLTKLNSKSAKDRNLINSCINNLD